MGRAMLIICAGVLVSLGFVAMGTQQQGRSIMKNNAGYAEFTQAKNRAHTAIQMSFQEMNQDPNWAANHGKSNPWYTTIEGETVQLYVDVFHDDPEFFAIDSVRIFSSAIYGENSLDTAKVISVYNRNEIDLVPEFIGGITGATDKINFKSTGSASISGNDTTSGCTNKPGINVSSDKKKAEADTATAGITVEGNPPIETDTTLSYKPTDQLIKRLEGLSTVQHLSGTYKGEMGTKEEPGVFFIDNETKLTGGISEGYGIMVVKSGGELAEYDSSGTRIDIAGNFTFNGLVIFEDAFNLKGRGTPTINGTVLVGNSDNYTGQDLTVDLSGNLHIQYRCKAEKIAEQAAAKAFQQGQYKRIVTYE